MALSAGQQRGRMLDQMTRIDEEIFAHCGEWAADAEQAQYPDAAEWGRQMLVKRGWTSAPALLQQRRTEQRDAPRVASAATQTRRVSRSSRRTQTPAVRNASRAESREVGPLHFLVGACMGFAFAAFLAISWARLTVRA